MLLRESTHAVNASYESLIARARAFRATDAEGDRAGFIALAELAAEKKQAESKVSASGVSGRQ